MIVQALHWHFNDSSVVKRGLSTDSLDLADFVYVFCDALRSICLTEYVPPQNQLAKGNTSP